MLSLHYDLDNEKVKYLISTDEKLGKLIRYINKTELIIEEDGFKCIVKYIIGQQISDKARETIWQRVCAILKNITPEKILAMNDNELRKVGLSERKINYIKILSFFIYKFRPKILSYIFIRRKIIYKYFSSCFFEYN